LTLELAPTYFCRTVAISLAARSRQPPVGFRTGST